jgi:polysaccharide export outer membrane protein
VLGVGDVVNINVWDQKELNTDSTIRPDGTITMPLIGDLKAAGDTPSALKNKIKSQLGNFLKGAGNEVVVSVKAWKSYRFTIQGEIAKNGVFSNDQYLRVADALAMAGGLTRFAKRDEIKLLRTDGKGLRQIPLDYDELASGKRPDMNIWVLPGDTIYVP